MLPLVVPQHHFLFIKLFPPPSSTMIPPLPWNQQSEAVFFPREKEKKQQIITLFEEPEQQQTFTLFEEPDQQQTFTLFEEPDQPQRSLWPIEETLPEQDLILFEEPQQHLMTDFEEQQQHLPQRSSKPLQQRHLQQQPLVAIVFPHQQAQPPQHTIQSARIIDVPQNLLESTIIESSNTQISNVELLRRHGIMDCSVIIGAFQPNEVLRASKKEG